MQFKKLPQHLAIIMDGNRRWAKINGFSIYEAYQKGLKNIENLVSIIFDELKIPILTLYVFSIDNWKRDTKEINYVFKLIEFFFYNKFENIKNKKTQIILSGNISALSNKVQKILNQMVFETQKNTDYILNIAINYSGRNEIIEACKKLLIDYKNNNISLEKINEDSFKNYLFHPKILDPDLLIRTSGEQRISNFLIWQIAYTELYFTKVLWPDLSKNDLYLALKDYEKRQRRFGGACYNH